MSTPRSDGAGGGAGGGAEPPPPRGRRRSMPEQGVMAATAGTTAATNNIRRSTASGAGGTTSTSSYEPVAVIGRYPVPAQLAFCPGGITYAYPQPAHLHTASTEMSEPRQAHIERAKQNDDLLRKHALLWHHRQQRGGGGGAPEASPPAAAAAAAASTSAAASPPADAASAGATATTTSGSSSLPRHFLPSLSCLSEAVFGRLTGCPPDSAKSWADAMVLSYFRPAQPPPMMSPEGEKEGQQVVERIPASEEEIILSISQQHARPSPPLDPTATAAGLLKHLQQQSERLSHSGSGGSASSRRRRQPCGYVFKRGDIAWNCRTCQSDPTCVICDECFRGSHHGEMTDHEVYFHRTTPGGCCDCGDVEAWAVDGCCDKHRPEVDAAAASAGGDVPAAAAQAAAASGAAAIGSTSGAIPSFALDDPMEAIRTAASARQWAIDALESDKQLSDRFKAALGVVIGAAVHCLLDAVDGSGVGADGVQWTKRWSDEAAKVANATPYHEDYYLYNAAAPAENNVRPATVQTFLTMNQHLPEMLRLHLRLHNDDVHTFDEVIDALHEPPHLRRSLAAGAEIGPDDVQLHSLVSLRENATEMTHHVDSDGQVTVKTYNNVAAAMRGFRRLKSRGLHCSVVSTAQVDAENRAKNLCTWLSEIAAAHPVAQALLVHALVQIPEQRNGGSNKNNNQDEQDLAGVHTWHPPRMIPPWVAIAPRTDPTTGRPLPYDEVSACRHRFDAFPPHLTSSFVTREESELLHGMALASLSATVPSPGLEPFLRVTGTVPDFYTRVPYRLPSKRYHKSPHALWGTLPSHYSDPVPIQSKHPLLERFLMNKNGSNPQTPNRLLESVYVVDTDLRKQQEGERITLSVFPHKLPGLNIISGVGSIRASEIDARRPPLPSPMDLRHLLATSSFRAPLSPLILLLLLDPYPTKQLRGSIHALFLSLLTNARFKARFAGALAIAYRPLSTLFCAGVGTEADTPLHFTVQIFTAGSLVRALGHGLATEALLLSDQNSELSAGESLTSSMGVFVPPISHVIARCIHTNLLGSTKEVNMILNNTASGSDENSYDENTQAGNTALLPALTYVAGEHPLMTPLPAAPDDGFLDSRSTRHKRLPHLLRDLDYVIETPGTAVRILLPARFPVYQGPSLSFRGEDLLSFSDVFARMLRLAQGMDPQKRKISGGHVEYEQNRWLEAFGLSLNFGGTRDAIAENPCSVTFGADESGSEANLIAVREAIGNVIASLLREVKMWLYREGMLETGLPMPPGGANGPMDHAQAEALQRSTLHVSNSQLGSDNTPSADFMQGASSSVALSCATGVKMTEAQLTLIENALKIETAQQMGQNAPHLHGVSPINQVLTTGPLVGDWLRVPHSPLAGDSLSFHLPLHRALAKCVKSICSVVIPENIMAANPGSWWKIPVLDDNGSSTQGSHGAIFHPLVPLIRLTLRSSNCRVVWSAGPECNSQEAQRRRSRSRIVSANIAVAKVLHSLADHPIRCLAAAQQIERHLWARNGTSVTGMAMNYSSAPLCRSFRDLDLLLVQLSAAGMSCGLGARRIFSLLLSRFSMDGYLCDPERRVQSTVGSPGGSASYGSPNNNWVNPPRLQDPDHAVVLAESFFSSMCVLVTELPPPPPTSASDDNPLRRSIRRELIHALAAEPRSHSEAMTAASCGISRREESEGAAGKGGSGGLFRSAFTAVLQDIGKQKSQNSSRAASGPAAFELKPKYSDEYDPTFFHLRRQEHQHAMDIVARLRKQKWGSDKDAPETHCLPLVCAPPKAHPRFLPCRLLLHLESMDAALRRTLLFAVTNGSWLPPAEPVQKELSEESGPADMVGISSTITSLPGSVEIPMTTYSRRIYQTQSSGATAPKRSGSGDQIPFSAEVVAASSVSFLEVLQLLTLQVHTLEECAALHREVHDLDSESRSLSAGLSINSYLARLVRVPDSLIDVWALRPYPDGPLKSKGSGLNRGSILGLLIALYEHRSDHGAILDNEGGADYGQTDDGHGGAKSLASSGLKWLLRFFNALVDGAPSVGIAVKSATTGVRIGKPTSISGANEAGSGAWTINDEVKTAVSGMLENLPDLWPKPRKQASPPEKAGAKSSEAGKAAQQRIMEMMKQKQAAFAAKMDVPLEGAQEEDDEETELCIICRCSDTEGENNGPLGYLGHVQRSRAFQIRATRECLDRDEGEPSLVNSYRVVGHMGCQLRETEAMDSAPLTCLPKGSVVSVLRSKVSSQYGIASRRVLVRHVSKDAQTNNKRVTEGWASVQSSQGYVILSPLISLCYTNSRWGTTRPVIKQCGHAAHLKCVETHTLSLHQRNAGEQPYDGRFAANISDGEFLCPLCKQLTNILIPRDNRSSRTGSMDVDTSSTPKPDLTEVRDSLHSKLLSTRSISNRLSPMMRRALEDFGSHLYTAMSVPWERAAVGAQKKHQDKWHSAIQKWDFEEDDFIASSRPDSVKSLLRRLRQQLISWAAIGHNAATLEAGSRGVEEVLPFGVLSETSDPWPEYSKDSVDSHPMLLELKRMISGSSGLLEVFHEELTKQLGGRDIEEGEVALVSCCLADIFEGRSWVEYFTENTTKLGTNVALWSELSALMASLPSHVSRDGTISQRSEARTTAAAMWAVKGLPCDASSRSEPPAPLALNRLFNSVEKSSPIPPNWGTMNPFIRNPGAAFPRDLFRPAVASAFLYTPMLAWDLYTLSGALLTSILSVDDKQLPTGEELLHLSHCLLVGRIAQAAVTPKGLEVPDETELDEEDCWTDTEVEQQGPALAKFVAHCREMTKDLTLKTPGQWIGNLSGVAPKALLAGVGRAILPFARALILLLRASYAAIRERQERSGEGTKNTACDEQLLNVLCSNELMAVADGFHIAKALHCPKPVDIVDDQTREWFALVNRWLIALNGLELHHGSTGRSILQMAPAGSSQAAIAVTKQEGLIAPGEIESNHVFSDESTDDMAMEIDEPQDRMASIRRANNEFSLEADDSDDELADSMDEAEEMVHLDLVVGQNVSVSAVAGNHHSDDSSDHSSSVHEDGHHALDVKYANVSRSPILPYQPSILGGRIGPGRHNSVFEFSIANEVMSDRSHFGITHNREMPSFTLIRLPKSFVELYNIVNKVKGRDDVTAMDESDDTGNSETAICLLTGAVMRSGSTRRVFSRAARPPGSCTLHARKIGSGIGVFFLVQKCTVLLMHNNKSAYSPSLYVDEHGEEDPQLRRGRPLFLNEARYRALELLWRQQGIPREVAQIRSTSDRVIRDNWY